MLATGEARCRVRTLRSTAPTSGQKEAREGIRTQTPREARAKQRKEGEHKRKPRNKYSDRDRCRRAKARRGYGSNYETQPRWYFRTGLRTKVGEPTARGISVSRWL